MKTFIKTVAPYLLALIDISIFTTIMGMSILISLSLLPLLYLTRSFAPLPSSPPPKTNHSHTLTLTPIFFNAGDFVGSHSCETTPTSPLTDDVRACAEKLYALPQGTKFIHTSHGECTNVMANGSAAVAVCGDKGEGVYYHQAAWAAEAVARNCDWGGVSQGTVMFHQVEGVRVVVGYSGYELEVESGE